MASPSEFLTFYRGTARLSMQRQCRIVAASPRRSFVSSSCRYSSGYTKDGKDNTHATKNKDQLDVQSANSASARGSKSRDEGGAATQEKDTNNATAKAKKDHPEAPDVVIGMQDERGGKGA